MWCLDVTGQFMFENGNVFKGSNICLHVPLTAVSNESCFNLLSEMDI